MSLGSILGGLIAPVSNIIDQAVTDGDERARLKHELDMAIQTADREFMAALVASRAQIIQDEAKGNFLQRSWRPMMMLFFAALLGMYWFGLAPDYLVENPKAVDSMFDLLQLGIGGYLIGRSVEKGIANWRAADTAPPARPADPNGAAQSFIRG